MGASALPESALQIFLFFLTRKAFSPPFSRENKLLKCEMKPCLIKKGIRQAGAIPLVEQDLEGGMKANPSLPARMNPMKQMQDFFLNEQRPCFKDPVGLWILLGTSNQLFEGGLAHCLCMGNAEGREKRLLLAFQVAWLCFKEQDNSNNHLNSFWKSRWHLTMGSLNGRKQTSSRHQPLRGFLGGCFVCPATWS